MKKLILSLAVIAMLVPSFSLAAYWKADESVSITALQPVEDNAYIAASTIAVSGAVDGDLFAAASTISLSGDVSRDIMAAGSLVNISGVKAEDIRVAGSSVNIEGVFSGELMVAGAQVTVGSGTQVAKGSYLMGSALSFNGKSAGDVSISGERVEFNGSAKSLTVKTPNVLLIGPDAVIQGDLNYSSPSEAAIDPGASISGKVNFTQAEAAGHREHGLKAAIAGFLTTVFLLKLLAIVLAAYLIWYLRRKDAVEVVQHGLSKFGASLLRGFVFLVVVPAGIIVLCFTVIGLPIAIFSALVYAALLMLASPFSVLLASSLLIKRKVDLQWYHILLGAVVLAILSVIPLIGWLAIFIVYLASLGSLLVVLRAKFKR